MALRFSAFCCWHFRSITSLASRWKTAPSCKLQAPSNNFWSSVGIREKVEHIRQRIAAAAQRAGRSPEAIQLMAVSKTVEPARIIEAYDAGLRLFGENRVQEFAGKHEAVRHLEGAEFHLIGHLQTNKAAQAAELFAAIDSVDSIRLAQRLNPAAAKLR